MVGFQTKLKHGEQVADFPHHPGPRQCRVRPARRPASQHVPQFAEAARRDAAAQSRAAAALCRTDHRLRGLCRVGGDRAPRRALRRGGAARRDPGAAAADHRARRAARPHHRRPYRDHRRRAALVSADERQFRPVPAARLRSAAGSTGRRRRRAGAKECRQKARIVRTRASGSGGLDWRGPAAAAE